MTFEYICLICGERECVEASDINEAFDIARHEGHEPASIPEPVYRAAMVDCE